MGKQRPINASVSLYPSVKKSLVLLITILTEAQETSSVQAVRVKNQTTFLNDQDALRTITGLGIVIEEIADDSNTHAGADGDDVVGFGGCLLWSKLEP